MSNAKHAKQAARAERLARALRNNLHRRKEQARERDTAAADAVCGNPEPDEGEPPA